MGGKVDWKSFISQHDLIYEEAGKVWQDGLPIGNGDIGVLAYAPFSPEFVINKIDVYDHRVSPRKRILSHKEALEILNSSPTITPLCSEESAAVKISKLEATEGEDILSPKTCCQLRVTFCRDNAGVSSEVPLISQRLSIYDALLHTSIDRHFCHPRMESFVSSQNNVLCIRVRDVSPLSSWSNFAEIFYTRDSLTADPQLNIRDNRMVLDKTMPDGLRYVVMAQVISKGWSGIYKEWLKKNRRPRFRKFEGKINGISVDDHVLQTSVSGDFDLFLTVATSDEYNDPLEGAKKTLDKAIKKGFGSLLNEHRRWWYAFWQKSLIEIDDFGRQQLYYLSLYQMASCYRKAPVPGLTGLWYGPNESPKQLAQWAGRYHADQNCQGPVFPLFACNHPELAEGYYDTWLKMLPKAREVAKKVFGIDGAYLPGTCGPRGEEAGATKYIAMCSGPYNGLLFAWGYEFTRDRRLLEEKVYPFLREMLDFFAAYMSKGEGGRYRLYPSQSPELGHMNTTNATFMISLLKVCFKTGVEATKILETDSGRRAKWEDILAHYPEYPVGKGMFLEAKEVPPGHYVSCGGGLYPLFPCGEFGPEGDEKMLKTARKTFQAFYDGGLFGMFYGLKKGEHRSSGGWPWFFITMWALRLGYQKKVWEELIPLTLKASVKPSGLMGHDATHFSDPRESERAHNFIPDRFILDGYSKMPLRECRVIGGTPNPRVKEYLQAGIEGNGYYMTVLLESLLQSHGGLIRLFPGIPEGREARFINLRARGAFLVSSELKKERVSYFTIRSLVGGTVKIKNPWPKKRLYLKKPAGRIMEFQQGLSSEIIELCLKPEEEVCLSPDKKTFGRINTEKIVGKMDAQPRPLIEDGDYTIWLGKPLIHPFLTRCATEYDATRKGSGLSR
ncbi:MAG: glycoside hydrolase N-terminal domain-containing protein [Candidatus Omnitrophota bacterium]